MRNTIIQANCTNINCGNDTTTKPKWRNKLWGLLVCAVLLSGSSESQSIEITMSNCRFLADLSACGSMMCESSRFVVKIIHNPIPAKAGIQIRTTARKPAISESVLALSREIWTSSFVRMKIGESKVLRTDYARKGKQMSKKDDHVSLQDTASSRLISEQSEKLPDIGLPQEKNDGAALSSACPLKDISENKNPGRNLKDTSRRDFFRRVSAATLAPARVADIARLVCNGKDILEILPSQPEEFRYEEQYGPEPMGFHFWLTDEDVGDLSEVANFIEHIGNIAGKANSSLKHFETLALGVPNWASKMRLMSAELSLQLAIRDYLLAQVSKASDEQLQECGKRVTDCVEKVKNIGGQSYHVD